MNILQQSLFLKPQGKDHDVSRHHRGVYLLLGMIVALLIIVFYLDSAYHINSVIGSEIIITNNMIHHYFDPNFSYAQQLAGEDSSSTMKSSSYRYLFTNNTSFRHSEVYDTKKCPSTIPMIDHGPHIVPPPEGPMTLVCCQTTKGVLNIAVHPTWAPIGAANFLRMVESGYISTKLPLFRVRPQFLIQFGLSSTPSAYYNYKKIVLNGTWLRDDPSWLPLGPSGRVINGIPRYQSGYVAYAGAANNSRGTQLIIANAASQYLGGGCPWEVPFAQLVGDDSYKTLYSLYSGYGENVWQRLINQKGMEYLKDFPLLDYMLYCKVSARNVPWKYQPS
jgi:peptidyl-prolyl cis-trans isomerase A (cyclophilin A)